MLLIAWKGDLIIAGRTRPTCAELVDTYRVDVRLSLHHFIKRFIGVWTGLSASDGCAILNEKPMTFLTSG